MMKNIVVIGGGSGVSAILKGLKEIEVFNLTAIITVADDGGSTGRLRSKYNMPAVGDIRNVLVALAEDETLLKELMDYRFSGDSVLGEDIEGHSLGNLILAALTQRSGDLMHAIHKLESILRIKGSIIPSTVSVVDLMGEMKDGTIVRGESNIRNAKEEINRVYFEGDVECTESAKQAILEADIILLGIGSLYTSILPNLIIEGIRESIKQSKGEVIYLSNIMSEAGETDGYALSHHIEAIESHLGTKIDTIIYPSNEIPQDVLQAYREEDAFLVDCDLNNLKGEYQVHFADLLSFDKKQARHNPKKIEAWFRDRNVM